MKFPQFNTFTSQLLLLLAGLLFSAAIDAQIARFTVVLDAGHGGHDPGAQNGAAKEKDINLAVTLDLGRLIEQNMKDVKVVYTRKTDVFLELQERADIVNNNHADLFICIHTNAAKGTAAYGAETYSLGLPKSKGNLDVAMRENSVILLEDDYKTKYKGFDPTSVESYIMFEFMQDKYIDRSVEFSSNVQNQFTTFCKRSDRGVRQANFWVLYKSACPSVLIELGFISNPSEMKYLTSDSGQSEMAKAIFNAFVNFKRNHDRKSGREITEVAKFEPSNKVEQSEVAPITDTLKNEKEVIATVDKNTSSTLAVVEQKVTKTNVNLTDKTPIYKVQLFASESKLKSNAANFKGLKGVECYFENGLYKYTYGSEQDNSKIKLLRKEVITKFPQAFIIAFVGDKRISEKEALKLNK